MEQEFQRPPGTQTIDRAAQLLTLVLEGERPRPLAELAGAAALPKSTTSRLLGALERQGLVQQLGRRGSFEPGPVLRRFAHRGQLVELAQPHLEALSAASGETINLAVPGPLGVEHVAQIESRHFLGTGQWVGRRVPYHCTAVGKVLIAFGGAEPGPLEPLTPATIVDPDRLATEVARIRRNGYATAVDELEVGLSGLAAPVFGSGGRALAALSISGPTLRLAAEQIADIHPKLLYEAQALGHDMGADAA
ncbi:MAG TPA: IclR family transcriptional regulator [Solirubrobacteraceae bacterium]|nr:IclR family transcriptional regulator [Solirubrobacteraceae bacterium]